MRVNESPDGRADGDDARSLVFLCVVDASGSAVDFSKQLSLLGAIVELLVMHKHVGLVFDRQAICDAQGCKGARSEEIDKQKRGKLDHVGGWGWCGEAVLVSDKGAVVCKSVDGKCGGCLGERLMGCRQGLLVVEVDALSTGTAGGGG